MFLPAPHTSLSFGGYHLLVAKRGNQRENSTTRWGRSSKTPASHPYGSEPRCGLSGKRCAGWACWAPASHRRAPRGVAVSHPPGCGGPNRFGIPFWGEFTTHFRTYLSGCIESDVHWGYDLDFEPWPCVACLCFSVGI